MAYLRKHILNILLFILWMGMAASLTTAHAEVQGGGAMREGYSMTLAFRTYLDSDLPGMDVFIERGAGGQKVYRPTMRDDLNTPLFTSSVPVPRGSFEQQRMGPFPKGNALKMSLGQWDRHEGNGTFTCVGGEGTIVVSFAGLVPNGVYTLWHTFTAAQASRPFSGYLDLPLGSRDGSTSVFVANAEGEAAFTRTFSPCLQMSDTWITSMLAVNYHSDGRTHAGRPGAFGNNVHTPLFLLLPQRDSLPASE